MPIPKVLEETALRLERLGNVFQRWQDYHDSQTDFVTAEFDVGNAGAYCHCGGMLDRFIAALRDSEAALADTLLDLERDAPKDV